MERPATSSRSTARRGAALGVGGIRVLREILQGRPEAGREQRDFVLLGGVPRGPGRRDREVEHHELARNRGQTPRVAGTNLSAAAQPPRSTGSPAHRLRPALYWRR